MFLRIVRASTNKTDIHTLIAAIVILAITITCIIITFSHGVKSHCRTAAVHGRSLGKNSVILMAAVPVETLAKVRTGHGHC